MTKPNCPIIAIEEHYWDPELTRHYTGIEAAKGGDIEKQLNDLGIFHYSQIAELNEKAAHNVGEEVGLPGRVPGWVAKAKELTAE